MDRRIPSIQVDVASLDRPVSSLCMTLQAQKILTHLSFTRVSVARQIHSRKASLAGETTLEQACTRSYRCIALLLTKGRLAHYVSNCHAPAKKVYRECVDDLLATSALRQMC